VRKKVKKERETEKEGGKEGLEKGKKKESIYFSTSIKFLARAGRMGLHCH
jgi:hypothetical protein